MLHACSSSGGGEASWLAESEFSVCFGVQGWIHIYFKRGLEYAIMMMVCVSFSLPCEWR